MDAHSHAPGTELPWMPVVGTVDDEEAFSIQQIATVTRWLRHFSELAVPTPR